jgi:hypothetical protein
MNEPSLKEFFRVTFGVALGGVFNNNDGENRPPPQPLQVIGAGLPRTGTASFVNALSKLGLRSYHMKDGAIETPGHLDMWYILYNKEYGNRDTVGSTTISVPDILDDMAVQGFTATADSPTCFWYKEQMERYPNAKVVLTVRGAKGGSSGGEAWKRSFSTNIIDAVVSFREIPFRWVPMFQKIDRLNVAMFEATLGTAIDPDTKFPVKDQLPEAYDRWVANVKAYVPEENLLVHAAEDGWEPLCEFLSPLSSNIESRCQTILASGEPYPNVNDKAKVQGVMVVLRGFSTFCKLLPVFMTMAILVTLWRRRSRMSKAKSE